MPDLLLFRFALWIRSVEVLFACAFASQFLAELAPQRAIAMAECCGYTHMQCDLF